MIMVNLPLISAIILNWNGRDCLYPCIRSVKEQSYPNMEIILVDNASTDGSVEYISHFFRDLRVKINERNLGYGGGNNRGIEQARGEYILILNNDTEVEKDCVRWLWESIEMDGRIGAVTPKIVLYEQKERVDAAGLTIYRDGLSIGRGHLEPQTKYNRREEVFCGSGCASLFRREMLDEIGLFDEDFFAYAEDTDLGWRARLAGWKTYYVPEAVVYHHHSKKFGTYSPIKAFYIERNRIWVAWKNFPPLMLWLWPFYTLSRYFYQGTGVLFRRGAGNRFRQELSSFLLLSILMKSLFCGLKEFPVILKKRRKVQRGRRITREECYRLFKRFGIKAREIAFKE